MTHSHLSSYDQVLSFFEVVEIPELVKVEVTEMATEESEDVPVEVPLEEPAIEVW